MSASADYVVTRRIDHEPSSLSAGAVVFVIGGMGLLIVAAIVISWIVIDGFSNVSPAERNVSFPKPGVEPNQAFERLEAARRDESALWSYGRAERDPGFATIPIDRAMALLNEQHLAGLSVRNESTSSDGESSQAPEPVEAER